MSEIYRAAAYFLFVTLLVGLIRVHRGPTRSDRMLAAQLFGTTGTAIVLLIGAAYEQPGARDVALVFVLLAVVNSFAFAHGRWSEGRGK
jgi:multicomponent Na+:H+ antiporter subunit F